MALYNATNGARWANAMCTQQDGPHDTHGIGVSMSPCNHRPDTASPCPLRKLTKNNEVCLKCRVRVGLPDHKTPAEMDALKAAAVQQISEFNMPGHRRSYYTPMKYKLYKKHRSKCAMPWCTIETRGKYCAQCANMIRRRQGIGIDGEALYAKPERCKRAVKPENRNE